MNSFWIFLQWEHYFIHLHSLFDCFWGLASQTIDKISCQLEYRKIGSLQIFLNLIKHIFCGGLTITLPETNSKRTWKIGWAPIGKAWLPTIHFQVRTVSFKERRVSPLTKGFGNNSTFYPQHLTSNKNLQATCTSQGDPGGRSGPNSQRNFLQKNWFERAREFFFKERLGVSKISNPEAFIGDLERFFAKGSVSKHILSFNQKMGDAFGANPRRVFLFFIFFGCRFWFVMKRDVSFIFGPL